MRLITKLLWILIFILIAVAALSARQPTQPQQPVQRPLSLHEAMDVAYRSQNVNTVDWNQVVWPESASRG